MTPLHAIGNWLREMLMRVPMSVVRVMFVMVFVAVLCWVWSLSRDRTEPIGRKPRWDERLKWIATLALVAQIVIYTVF